MSNFTYLASGEVSTNSAEHFVYSFQLTCCTCTVLKVTAGPLCTLGSSEVHGELPLSAFCLCPEPVRLFSGYSSTATSLSVVIVLFSSRLLMAKIPPFLVHVLLVTSVAPQAY